MALASPVVELINIVLESVSEDEKTSLFRLASDTTVSELKRIWEMKHATPEGCILRKADGTLLADHQMLSDIEQATPGQKTINVSVEEAIVLQVGLYKCQIQEMKTITIGLNSRPEELHPQLRELFGLGEDRLFRLRSRDLPLLYDRSFEYQNLDSGASIFIDLGYEFHINDEWTSAVTKRFMYSSENASELLSDEDHLQRILLDGVQVNIHHDILSCLPAYYRQMTNAIVHHQNIKDITLLVNEFMKQRLVWPTDVSGRLMQSYLPLKPEMYFEDERLPTDTSMRQLLLPDHALVHTKTSVSVKLSDGKRKVLKVSDLATVGDVEAMVSSFEGSSRFVLAAGGRRLKTSDKIKTINDPSSIEVERPGDTMVVYLSDRSVRFHTEQRKLRFTDVMQKVAENGRLKLKKLVRIPLRCKGCSRRICLEEEAFQTIPSNCCRVRSLVLTDATPPKMKGKGMQGSWTVGQKRVGVGRRRVGRLVQTRRKRHAAVTETPPRLTRAQVVQIVRKKGSAATQHPPLFLQVSLCPPLPSVHVRLSFTVPRPFCVNDPEKNWKRRRFFTDLLLDEAPTWSQVLEAVAENLKVSPDLVELRRQVGYRRRDDVKVFYVCYHDRRLDTTYADSKGNYVSGSEVRVRRVEHLNNSDPFIVVPGWTNNIDVYPR